MIEIAKILKPHGIHGEVKAQLFSDNVESFCARGFVYVRKGRGHERIGFSPLRSSGRNVYMRIDGVETRNDAEKIRGEYLYIDRSDFDETDEGEYYVLDLVGLKIVDDTGSGLGVLREVLQHGAADVYVIDAPNGFMFPALKRVIKNVDIEGGTITVDSAALEEVAVYED